MQTTEQITTEAYFKDYLYVDRERLAGYHTQLLGSGTPLESKLIENYTRSETSTAQVGIPKIVSGTAQSLDDETVGKELRFDLGWLNVLQTIDELERRGYIADNAIGLPVGSLIRMHGAMQIADLRLVKDLWPTFLRKLDEQKKRDGDDPIDVRALEAISKVIPHPIVINFTSSESEPGKPLTFGEKSTRAWGILAEENVIGSSDTFSLMNGGFVVGEYEMIGVLEVGASPGLIIDVAQAFPPSNSFGITLGLQQEVRAFYGRPDDANGITPLTLARSMTKV